MPNFNSLLKFVFVCVGGGGECHSQQFSRSTILGDQTGILSTKYMFQPFELPRLLHNIYFCQTNVWLEILNVM